MFVLNSAYSKHIDLPNTNSTTVICVLCTFLGVGGGGCLLFAFCDCELDLIFFHYD